MHSGKPKKVWPVVQVAAGNLLEMYDFTVFGYYAAAIGRAFFPGGSEYASLMKSLMTFGAGYLMRPDQHVCARWLTLDAVRLQAALNCALPQ